MILGFNLLNDVLHGPAHTGQDVSLPRIGFVTMLLNRMPDLFI